MIPFKNPRHWFLSFVVLLTATACTHVEGQGMARDHRKGEERWSIKIAESFLQRYPDSIPYNASNPSIRWNYEPGLMYWSLLQLWEETREQKYFDVVRNNLDLFIGEDGSIKTYRSHEQNLDMILPGRALLRVYHVTKERKYKAAAETLRSQLHHQPRTASGGFWHKNIYPNQMWLDGIYMAHPFAAEYAAMFREPALFDDIAHQIILIEQKTRDPKTGLLYHGWDESRRQKWADPERGTSPNFWGRAMGWFAMGLVDVLDTFPVDHSKRREIISILQRLAAALVKYQDPKTGVWYQVVDQGGREGNYLESSASSMYTYAFAKGVRKGYLGEEFRAHAERAFRGILNEFVTIDEQSRVNLHHVCAVAGLGGNPYRDGSYKYYVSEPRRTNDFKGIGPLLLASLELERWKGNW
jgi:unsaturated rhamnogalacturonyl hydrolase